MCDLDSAERRARLVTRHHLSPFHPAHTVDEVVSSLVALHATDPSTVFLSILARCPEATIADIADTLYVRRTLIRMLGMRRTLFVTPRAFAPTVHHAASLDVAAMLRRRLLSQLGTLPTDPPLDGDLDAWLADVERSVVRALADRGSATAATLSQDEPRLRTAILPTTDKAYDVRRNITSQVLTLLGAGGQIIRARPRGEWNSRHHTWEPATAWLADPIPGDAASARVELVRAWLARFGPGTLADIQWWTGWAKGVTSRALGGVDTTRVDLDGVPGYVLAGDEQSIGSPDPAVALLPALDPTPMGYTGRNWFFACDPAPLFDRFGNIGPTVWWGGEIVGGWAVRGDGTVAWSLLTDRGAQVQRQVAEAAAALEQRLEGRTVTPTFPTPLERELRTS